jgi:hypothetical protein
MIRHAVTAVLVFALSLSGTVAAPAAATNRPPEKVLLDGNSFWRGWVGWRTVELLTSEGRLIPIYDKGKNDTRPARPISSSATPPADWMSCAFDDSPWARTQGPFGINAWAGSYVDVIGPGNPGEVAMICLRGRFSVDDPATATGLTLSLRCHGGVAVWLNGVEIGRSHLPKGEIAFGVTQAEKYPDDCYLDPNGKVLNERVKDFPDRYQARLRAASFEIPVNKLVKGANVLAVTVCRAPTAEIYRTAKSGPPSWPGPTTPWPHAKIDDIRLVGPAGMAATAANARTKGIRVWNRSILELIDATDFDDPSEALAPMRIVGCRNGFFSGQIVVGSDQPIVDLVATAGDLRQTGGGGVIPSARCRIRYALPDCPPAEWYNAPPRSFDTLVDAPPRPVSLADKRGGAVCPVWLTVAVPADVPPGRYTGQVTIRAAGLADTPVEVQLTVAPFVLPDPKNLQPHVDLIQSPDSVAMQYKVDMWSARHWELLEKTFELLGQTGNKTVYLPLLRQTHFGNEQTMVRWAKGADGKLTLDYTVLDKYLDLAVKYLGKPPVVCLYIWDRFCGEQYLGTKDVKVPTIGYLYSQIDPATGKVIDAEGPKWDSPEIVTFLQQLVDGVKGRLAVRGLDGSMMLGLSGDQRPTKAVAEVIKQAAPGVKWVSQAHPSLYDLFGIPCGYVTTVWNAGAPADPQMKRHYWKPGKAIYGTFPREGHKCIYPLRASSSPVVPRMISEACVAAGLDGIGRVGADFWNVLPGRRDWEGGTAIVARYPQSSWSQLGLMHASNYMLGPGPNGPCATVRFELLREGVQTTHVRMQIEQAIGDKATREKVGEDLASRCDRLLDARTYSIMRAGASGLAGGARRNPYWWGFVSSSWQDRDAELFVLGAEVMAKRAAN